MMRLASRREDPVMASPWVTLGEVDSPAAVSVVLRSKCAVGRSSHGGCPYIGAAHYVSLAGPSDVFVG